MKLRASYGRLTLPLEGEFVIGNQSDCLNVEIKGKSLVFWDGSMPSLLSFVGAKLRFILKNNSICGDIIDVRNNENGQEILLVNMQVRIDNKKQVKDGAMYYGGCQQIKWQALDDAIFEECNSKK